MASLQIPTIISLKDMDWSFDKEIVRKVLHLLSVFVLASYLLISHYFNHELGLFFLLILLVIAIILEYLRVEVDRNIPIIGIFWNYIKRKRERNTLGSEVYFLLGSIIALSIFDIRIAIVAILMTIFGDATAAIIGYKFGKTPIKFIKGKAWEGAIAEFGINVLVGLLIIPSMWWIVIIMALVATTVEVASSKIDDNILIPIFGGLAGHVLLFL